MKKKKAGDLMKDTNVKSSIRKAMGMLQGKLPKLDPDPLLDQWMEAPVRNLHRHPARTVAIRFSTPCAGTFFRAEEKK